MPQSIHTCSSNPAVFNPFPDIAPPTFKKNYKPKIWTNDIQLNTFPIRHRKHPLLTEHKFSFSKAKSISSTALTSHPPNKYQKRTPTMKRPPKLRTPDHTRLILSQEQYYRPFMNGYIKILQSNLKQVKHIGQNYSYTIYTCGEPQAER